MISKFVTRRIERVVKYKYRLNIIFIMILIRFFFMTLCRFGLYHDLDLEKSGRGFFLLRYEG